jgi:hypothetical protein
VKKGWAGAGRLGTRLGPDVHFEQEWTPLLFDGSSDPELYKTAGLEPAPFFPDRVNSGPSGPTGGAWVGLGSSVLRSSRDEELSFAQEVERRWNGWGVVESLLLEARRTENLSFVDNALGVIAGRRSNA